MPSLQDTTAIPTQSKKDFGESSTGNKTFN